MADGKSATGEIVTGPFQVPSIRCAEHALPGGQVPLIERDNRPGGYELISRRGPF